jgi:hypothetical protein
VQNMGSCEQLPCWAMQHTSLICWNCNQLVRLLCLIRTRISYGWQSSFNKSFLDICAGRHLHVIHLHQCVN